MIRRPIGHIHTQLALQRRWQRAVRGFGAQRWGVRVLFIAKDGSSTSVVRLDHLRGPLDHEQHEEFAGVLDHIFERRHRHWWRVAPLITRPGPAVVECRDLEWAASLYDVARHAGIACEIVHLAAGGRVIPLPPDDMPDLAVGF